MKDYYRRNLPHVVPIGGTFFITSRLKGSLPYDVLRRLQEKQERELHLINVNPLLKEEEKILLRIRAQENYFSEFDDQLDQVVFGPTWLEHPDVAEVVASKFMEYDGKHYDLIAYTIMKNHIHLLIDTSIQINRLLPAVVATKENTMPLSKIMQLVKGGSSFKANRLLNRVGAFWQDESYDHLVRNGREFEQILKYIAYNPVKAKMVADWKEWKFTFVKEEYIRLV